MIETTAIAKHRRSRQANATFFGVPDLRLAHRNVLTRWLASNSTERNWQPLLRLAGADNLDLSEELLAILVESGVVTVKEEFKNGRWWPTRVVWRDLPGTQRAMNLQPASERLADRQLLLGQIQTLAERHEWASSALQSCLQPSLSTEKLRAREQLLQALSTWHAEQRFGMRQDFALWSRGHTKAITNSEWEWLENNVALENFAIARFEPVLWIGGGLTLQTRQGSIDIDSLGFLGMPAKSLIIETNQITRLPLRYWLIENRASFERCVLRANATTCVIWLPGRPPNSWLEAVDWLLKQAPAPAEISCDPDPAGIEIALTAGKLWADHGLKWEATHMASNCWKDGPTLPLNEYDYRLLGDLKVRTDIPSELIELQTFILLEGRKAEQEGWL